MDTTISKNFSASGHVNMFSSPFAFIEANRLCDFYGDRLILPSGTTHEEFKYEFRRYVLSVWKNPEQKWLEALPYAAFTHVPYKMKKEAYGQMYDFVRALFFGFAQKACDMASLEIRVSGGFAPRLRRKPLSHGGRVSTAKGPFKVSKKEKKTRVSHQPSKKCNRVTSTVRKQNSHLLFGLGGDHCFLGAFFGPVFQSGVGPQSFDRIPSKTSRDQRERAQRFAAARKIRQAEKALPKKEREQRVKAQRDKRNPVVTTEEVELQNGGVIKAVAIAVTSFAAGTIYNGVRGIARKAGEVVQEANKFIKAIKGFLGNPIWMVPVACMCVWFISKPVFRFASEVLSLVMQRLFPKKLWEEVAPAVSSVRYQDGSNLIGKVMASVCVFSVFRGMKLDGRTMSEFVKRMSCLPKLTESLSLFSDWIVSAVETAVNFFRGLFGKEAMSLRFGKNTQLNAWYKKVEMVLKQHQTMKVVPSPQIIDSWVALIGEAHELREIYRGTPLYRGICEMYDRLLVVVKPYKGSINARNNFRVEPEMLLLTGAPGIGKTVLTMWVCAAILKRSGLAKGSAESVLREIWQKGCSEYWNGYAGQLALIIDDAFQMHGDKTDKDNDFINVIRAISSWAFPLNFADVESKGAIYFTSQLVVATTNRTNLEYGTEMIHDMGAVYRRIGHGYQLKLNPKFATLDGRLDYQKLKLEKAACSDGAFPWHIWSLERHNFETGRSIGVERSLEEVIDEIAASLVRKNAAHAAELTDLTAFIEAEDVRPASINQDEFIDVALQAGDSQHIHANNKVLFWRNEEDVLDQTLRYRVLNPFEEKLLGFTEWFTKHVANNKITKLNGFIKRKAWDLSGDFSSNRILRELFYRYLLFGIYFILFTLTSFTAVSVVRAVLGIVKSIFGLFTGKHTDENKPVVDVQSNEKVPIRHIANVHMQNGDPNVVNNVESNCYQMVVRVPGDDSGAHVLGTGMFVCDTLFIFPTHFSQTIEQYPEGRIYFVNRLHASFTFSLPVAKFMGFKRNNKEEITFARFEGVRAHRNIINSFFREQDLKFAAGKPVSLHVSVCDMHLVKDELAFGVSHHTYYASSVLWNPNGAVFESIKLPRYFQYAACTKAGHCGSPLLTGSSNLFGGRAVLGLHIAGDNVSRGFSVPVSAETLTFAMQSLGVITDRFSEDLKARGVEHQVGELFHLSDSVSMLPICVLKDRVPMAQKTNFYRTRYFGAFGDCNLAPARQRPYVVDGVVHYPMLNAIAPYDQKLNLFEDAYDDLVHVAMQKFTALSRDFPRHIMDFDTAVLGDPRLEYFRSIPRGTAAGFPYSVQHGSGKKAFFGEGAEYDLNNPNCDELRSRVREIVTSAKEGVRLSHIFTDFLKDELRPLEKVRAGKTRLISASPLDYTIAFRMYFGNFMAAAMKHHVRSGMAPGVCVFTEWNSVLLEMTSMGKKICAGDFKSFDCSEQPPLHWAILRFINNWYNDEHGLVREVLWLELVHSRHLGGLGNDQRFIYQWSHSLPSGHPFTTIVNSMYSLCALVFSVCKSLGKPYHIFWSVANALTYGDDNLLNASDELVAQLPVATLADQMAKMGLTYTSDSKGAELEDWRDFSAVTFLKRSFSLGDGRVNAPLELGSFLYTFYFCKNKKLEREIFIDVMENALEELSMHGQERWDTFAPRVYALLSEQCVPRAPCQRLSYLEFIKARSDNWF